MLKLRTGIISLLAGLLMLRAAASASNLPAAIASPPPPAVTQIAPAFGPAGGGTIVTINGTNFDTSTNGTSVAFGANSATAVSCTSTTQCQATSPPQGAGPAVVHVAATTVGGTSTTGAADRFTYAPPGVWTAICGACPPPARSAEGLAYDAGHGQLVLFGGATSSAQNDTWLWDGTTWTQASPSTPPPVRQDAAMAFDGAHIVLFGGVFGGGSPALLGDTWAWDGTTWSQPPGVTSANSPAARQDAAIAFDAANATVVLFGGETCVTSYGTVYANDTWVWSGTAQSWTQVCTSAACRANSPSPRSGASLAFDPLSQKLVLFGGQGCGPGVVSAARPGPGMAPPGRPRAAPR